MRAKRFEILAIILAAAFSATAFPADTAKAQAPPAPKTIDELRAAIQASLTRSHVPGVGIALVARDHVIWAGGVGEGDTAAHKPVTASTNFRVGSVSKGFVALALLKLQEEGKIDLNAPVKSIAPEIEIHNPWEASDPVRVVNLLQHTAGFDDMHLNEVYNTADAPDIPLRDVFARFTLPQVVRWRPGMRMAYSNPGYGLAGYLIEKITGQKFEDYIQQNILDPLGMTHSSFLLSDAIRAHLSEGYQGNPPAALPYMNIYLRPAGNLMSSPEDMALWVRMLLNRGTLDGKEIVKPESIVQMEEPTTTLAARAGLKAGYGLGNYFDTGHTILEHGHDGGIAGFISDYRYLPDQGLGYVILFNSGSPGEAYQGVDKLVYSYVTAGIDPLAAPPAAQAPGAMLEEMAGWYQAENPRSQLFGFIDQIQGVERVYWDNGVLREKQLIGGKAEALVPVGGDQFRLEKEPVATHIFFTGDGGARVLGESDGLYAVRVSPAIPILRLVLIVGALLLMISALGFALIWVPRKLLGRMKEVKNLRVRVLPLLAVLSFIAVIATGMALFGEVNPGAPNVASVTLWIASWLFALFSIWALGAALVSRSGEIKRGVWIHSLLVAVSCCGIAAYLAWWHIIGLRAWAY